MPLLTPVILAYKAREWQQQLPAETQRKSFISLTKLNISPIFPLLESRQVALHCQMEK